MRPGRVSLLNRFSLQISLILIRSRRDGMQAQDASHQCRRRLSVDSVLSCGFLSSRLDHGGIETLLGLLPVDDLPHLFEVLRARVLVVKVIGVLPDVDVDDRDKVRAHIRDQVLVGSGTEVEGLLSLVVHEPAPAGSLDGGGARVEDADELLHGTPAADDSVVKGARIGESAVGLWAE